MQRALKRDDGLRRKVEHRLGTQALGGVRLHPTAVLKADVAAAGLLQPAGVDRLLVMRMKPGVLFRQQLAGRVGGWVGGV